MFSDLVSVQETCLFLQNQILISDWMYLKGSTSTRCFSFSWWSSSDFLLNYQFYLEAFWSFMPTCYHELCELRKESIISVASTRSSRCWGSSDCAIFNDIAFPNDLRQTLQWKTISEVRIFQQVFWQDYPQPMSKVFSLRTWVYLKTLGWSLGSILLGFLTHKVFLPFTTF